jgi:hypothetical protein
MTKNERAAIKADGFVNHYHNPSVRRANREGLRYDIANSNYFAHLAPTVVWVPDHLVTAWAELHWEDVAADTGDFDPVPVCKIFLTHIRWLVGAIYPTSLDRCFVLAKFAQDEPEFGDALLSDIVNTKGVFGTTPERDKYIKLDKPMSWYADHPRAW